MRWLLLLLLSILPAPVLAQWRVQSFTYQPSRTELTAVYQSYDIAASLLYVQDVPRQTLREQFHKRLIEQVEANAAIYHGVRTESLPYAFVCYTAFDNTNVPNAYMTAIDSNLADTAFTLTFKVQLRSLEEPVNWDQFSVFIQKQFNQIMALQTEQTILYLKKAAPPPTDTRAILTDPSGIPALNPILIRPKTKQH